MSNAQLNVELSLSKGSEKDPIFLEQEEFSAYVGKLTKAGMALAVLGWLYPDSIDPTSNNCGGEDGIFTTKVYAYLYDQELNYTFDLSYGSFSDRKIDENFYTEILKCGLKDKVEFSYPSEGIVRAEWVGGTYDKYGGAVLPPGYSSNNKEVDFTSKVWGSLRVTYKVIRHVYSVRIESRESEDPRETANKYQSVAYAVWDGGVTWIDVKAPYGFEEKDGYCGNGTIVIINPNPDPTDPPTVSPENTETHVEYCSQVADDE